MHHGDVSPEIAAGLLALKKRIAAAKIPPSQLDQTINVAVWNIREFGKKRRTLPAIHYIAEILGQFDLIALVELRDDLTDFGRVCEFLGPSWDLVYSDWMSDPGGNRERTGFLYDRRAVTFNGLAAEVDAPRGKKGTEYLATQSFWRAPYMCSFRAGNFDFVAVATHARWGDSIAGREAELGMLADWLDVRLKDKSFEDEDLIVMGDFNIPSETSDLFKAITSKGLMVPDKLMKADLGSNLEKNKRYDQILHRPIYDEGFCNAGGVVDFYQGDYQKLFPAMKSKQAFTYQMSDHLPLWMQINTDTDVQQLEQLIRG